MRRGSGAVHHGAGGRAKGAVVGAVGPDEVAESVVEICTLSRVDYVDHFTVDHPPGSDATPEEWARMMFGDTPDLIERSLWSGVLGFRLSEGRSADTIAGWSIDGRGTDWIRLAATGRAGAGELVVHATGTTLGLTTFMRYGRDRARMVWGPTSAVHRRLAPVLLRRTVTKMHGHGR